MRLHASCAARPGPNGYDAVLVTGAAGAGKSDLLLRLIGAGWSLVADDQVEVDGCVASAPAELAGLLEVRALGLFRLPFVERAALRLVARLGVPLRMPLPERDPALGLPVVTIDARAASAVAQLGLALEAACGRLSQLAGAFAP